MPRSHVRNLWTAFDTIASHSYHVATIAYILCKLEWLSNEDAQKACTIGVFHDLAEARTWDHDFVSKNYNTCDEHQTIHDQFLNAPDSEWLNNLLSEYESRASQVAQCTKDADMLAQMYHTWVLHRQGNKLAKQRLDGDKRARVPHLYTESVKKLLSKCMILKLIRIADGEMSS